MYWGKIKSILQSPVDKKDIEYNSLLPSKQPKRTFTALKWYIALAISFLSYVTIDATCKFDNEENCMNKFINPSLKIWFLHIVITSTAFVYMIVGIFKKPYIPHQIITISTISILFILKCDKKVSQNSYYGVINFIIIFTIVVLLSFYCLYKVIRFIFT